MSLWSAFGILLLSITTGFQLTTGPAVKETGWSLSGGFGAVRTPRQVVLRDAKAFEALWKELYAHGEPPPLPKIDFSRENIVGIWWGQKSTGGYHVEIGLVEIKRCAAVVHVVLWSPPKGAVLSQAFTTPFALKAVQKLPQKVTFRTQERITEPK
jgi:hypothetical protein